MGGGGGARVHAGIIIEAVAVSYNIILIAVCIYVIMSSERELEAHLRFPHVFTGWGFVLDQLLF